MTSVSIAGISNTLSYDSNGNITRYNATSGDDLWIDYDGANRAEKITKGSSSTTSSPTARDEFWYGPNGERFLRKATWMDGTLKTTWALKLGNFERVYPVHDTGVTYRSKVYAGNNSLVRFVQYPGSSTTDINYIHRDHLSSVDQVTSGAGNSIRNMSSDAFGARRKSNWAEDDDTAASTLQTDLDAYTPRGFTDHEMLDRTGIIHMNGRIYDPRIGRFMQPDPFVQAPSSTQSFNRYAYVFNSPLSLTDPSGFFGADADIENPGPSFTLSSAGLIDIGSIGRSINATVANINGMSIVACPECEIDNSEANVRENTNTEGRSRILFRGYDQALLQECGIVKQCLKVLICIRNDILNQKIPIDRIGIPGMKKPKGLGIISEILLRGLKGQGGATNMGLRNTCRIHSTSGCSGDDTTRQGENAFPNKREQRQIELELRNVLNLDIDDNPDLEFVTEDPFK